MIIKYHGHAFIEIQTVLNILIDPFITGNPLCQKTPDDFNPDYILLTHGHRDHYGDTESIARSSGCTVCACAELSRYITSKNIPTKGFNTGGYFELDNIGIYVTEAKHSNSNPDGSYGGTACGFVINSEGHSIYFAGDTSYYSDMKLISERFRINVAFLPIGGTYTMDIQDAVRASKLLGPHTTVPIHYNTFPAVSADPDEFSNILEQNGLKCIVLKPGNYMELKRAE